MILAHLWMLVLLLMHPMVAHLIHGSHLAHHVHGGVHWVHGIHLIHLTHVVHLMCGIHLIHLMDGIYLIHRVHLIHLMHGIHLIHLVHGIYLIHTVDCSIRGHASLRHAALFSHTVAPVHSHARSWTHVHLLVRIVHTHILRSLVATITIWLPTREYGKYMVSTKL